MMELVAYGLASFMYLAGVCKTMIDYEINDMRMVGFLLIWPLLYVYLIFESFRNG